jgi:hypothetical protein
MLAETITLIRDSVIGLAGGAWVFYLFSLKRERSPKLRLHHTIETIATPVAGKVHLRVTLRLENLGQTLIPLKAIRTDVNQLRPWPHSVDMTVSPAQHTSEDNLSELEWPTLASHTLDFVNSRREIEPGEDDQFTFDFILEHPLEIISLYSYVPNTSKPIRIKCIRQTYGEIGWSITTTHTLKSIYEPRQTINETRATQSPEQSTAATALEDTHSGAA